MSVRLCVCVSVFVCSDAANGSYVCVCVCIGSGHFAALCSSPKKQWLLTLDDMIEQHNAHAQQTGKSGNLMAQAALAHRGLSLPTSSDAAKSSQKGQGRAKSCLQCGWEGSWRAECWCKAIPCTRCGRDSHSASGCYAKTSVCAGGSGGQGGQKGRERKSSGAYAAASSQGQGRRKSCRNCGWKGPWHATCWCEQIPCVRCGRGSHSVRTCYATTNVSGEALSSGDDEGDRDDEEESEEEEEMNFSQGKKTKRWYRG